MKRRDFLRKITKAGWSLVREGGSHSVYGRKAYTFAVPRHAVVKPGIVRSWEKLNAKIDEEGE